VRHSWTLLRIDNLNDKQDPTPTTLTILPSVLLRHVKMAPYSYANCPLLTMHLVVRCLKPDLHHELSAPGGVGNRSYKFLLGFFDLIPDSLEFVTLCERYLSSF
jgi:hypothetical protein